MTEKRRRLVFRCSLGLGDGGTPEEFTSDMRFVARSDDIDHLSDDGLARVGTRVTPGMLLIGKIGLKCAALQGSRNELELLKASDEELRKYYNELLYDASVYAPEACCGTVVAASIQSDGVQQEAVVEVEV